MKSVSFGAVFAIALFGGCGVSENRSPEPPLAEETGRSEPAEAAFAEPFPPAALQNPGKIYGEEDGIEGVWFTNFENSRFLECSGKSCSDRPLRDWASVACSDQSCEMLDREARRIARMHGGDAPSGSFHIRFIGRRGTVEHEPRYLGDGKGEVWVERLLDMRMASGDL